MATHSVTSLGSRDLKVLSEWAVGTLSGRFKSIVFIQIRLSILTVLVCVVDILNQF